jgi:hypothetical protein
LRPPLVANTGGLLCGLASTSDDKPSFPEYEKILTSASLVIVPGLVLAEVDGTVAVVAERRYRVLTTDRRDFAAIRLGPRLTLALELLP